MANPFSETRLELGVAQFYGAFYSLTYDTLITTMGGGSEQRRINWDQGIIGIQLSTRVLNTEELTYLLAFHEARNGAYEGFRVKDWSDYKAINQPLGTGDGTEKTFQLVKIYTVAGVSVTRAITKPVAGTVKVYLDGDEQEDNWSVDTTTGQVTTTLDGNLTASCEFDIPMRFEQDKIDSQFNAYRSDNKFFDGQGFSLIELRNKAEIPFDTVPQSLDHLFALYYDYGTIGGPEFSTSIIKTESGFEDRLQNWESSLGKWNVGNRRLNRAELDYFIALFRVCRGRGVAFNFKDWQSEIIKRVRFDEDKISFSFSAFRAGDEEVFFDLGGIGVRQTEAIVCTPKTVNFSDLLTSVWSIFDAKTTGAYAGASYDVNTSGGYWRTTLDFGDGISGFAGYIEWDNGWTYTPTHPSEIISINWRAECRIISFIKGGISVSFNDSFPFDIKAWQSSNVIGFARIGPGGNDPGGVATNWTLKSASSTLSGFAAGIPITFKISRSNSNAVATDYTNNIIVTDFKNAQLTVNITCP